MEIILRLKAFVIFLYITGKWLGVTVWFVLIASMIWAEGATILLVSDRVGNPAIGIIFATFLFVPLIILSTLEWLVFGKFTWSYKSFKKNEK